MFQKTNSKPTAVKNLEADVNTFSKNGKYQLEEEFA